MTEGVNADLIETLSAAMNSTMETTWLPDPAHVTQLAVNDSLRLKDNESAPLKNAKSHAIKVRTFPHSIASLS